MLLSTCAIYGSKNQRFIKRTKSKCNIKEFRS